MGWTTVRGACAWIEVGATGARSRPQAGKLHGAMEGYEWTWVAVGLVLVESVVLAACGWTCPLTILTERLGAERGSVSDIFLPQWLADRIFPICGTTYAVALLILLFRLAK